jgi:hypothetical protein
MEIKYLLLAVTQQLRAEFSTQEEILFIVAMIFERFFPIMLHEY